MTVSVALLDGTDAATALEDLAALRMRVFRDFPYLYEGDARYEEQYLRSYADNPRAVLVVARDGTGPGARVIGAATGMPLRDHADAAGLTGPCPPKHQVFYCAESVLLPEYRGQGIGHRFFDLREQAARAQGFAYSLFCAVVRPPDHPLRPAGYRPLDPFWRKRAYAPVEGLTARFDWPDIGDRHATPHTLQAWMRPL